MYVCVCLWGKGFWQITYFIQKAPLYHYRLPSGQRPDNYCSFERHQDSSGTTHNVPTAHNAHNAHSTPPIHPASSSGSPHVKP